MTAPVKIKSKGTALLLSISSVYTAIPMITSISKSGEKSIDYESTTLDQTGTSETGEVTGYVGRPSIDADFFYDPTNAVHIALKALMRTPVKTNVKLVYTDSGPLDEIWPISTVGIDEKFEMKDGVKASLKLQAADGPTA